MYDAAIIGTGPAGLSAALTLKIHKKNIIWFGSKNICEKVAKAEKINNYPGFPAVSGAELAAAFQAHAQQMELEVTDSVVNNIVPMGDHYAILAGADFCEAKTVLLASGIAQTGTLPNEDKLLGHGVSYCATCDGLLYKGKDIAVILGAKRLEHEAEYLAGLAAHIDLFPTYKDCGIELPNVTVHTDRPKEISGEGHVEGIVLTSGESISVSGVFCLRTSVSLTSLIKEVETENGHIKVDRTQQTNLPGCYAAGDCTGRPYQYTKAAGEGNVAAHSIINYLAENK